MKTALQIIAAIAILANAGCANNTSGPNTVTSYTNTDTSRSDLPNRIDFDKTAVIKTVYVVNRQGADIKQGKDERSATLGRYEFGTKLDVIELAGNWLGVRDRTKRVYNTEGKTIEQDQWEKVYVDISATGPATLIQLIPAELNIVTSLTIDNKTEQLPDNGRALNNYIAIELVDSAALYRQRANAVNFLLADTTANKKVNGRIVLKCDRKTKVYVAKPDAEESVAEFEYVGQVEFLNRYLISGSYWESSDYRFIDKTSGEETEVFGDHPYISADRKHIICINYNGYESTADLEYYSIDNRHIKHLMSASFKNWLPAIEPDEIFWSTDGYLYLTVNHSKLFAGEDDTKKSRCQYMRIKPL